MAGVAGVLLTGGTSRRMGRDKASIPVDGVPGAVRIGTLLARIFEPVVEVGPACSGLPSVIEEDRHGGPLVALAAGVAELRRRGHSGSALVLACDLPRVHERLLRLLATWPEDGSVVPVVDGRPQYLCARFGAEALDAVTGLAASGERRMQAILSVGPVTYPGPAVWGAVATDADFMDIDEPEDLARAGLVP